MTVRRMELDAPALKALAHPLRVQILHVLDTHARASVTSLAEELGETTGAISYHLRQLARHGFVEESSGGTAEESGRRPVGRRPRWWRMAVDEIHVSGMAFLGDEDTREAAEFLVRESHAARSRRLADWFSRATGEPDEWQRASSDGDATLTLDAAQARAMADELIAVVNRYREAAPGPGARRVEVQWAVFPGARRNTRRSRP